MRVLITGGCGFIGRNLVSLLSTCRDEITHIRVADKRPPEMSYLSETEEAIYDDSSFVDYVQVDLSRKEQAAEAFKGDKFDAVVNLASETELGKPASVYKQLCTDVAVNCAREAVAQGSFFIHISDARMYKGVLDDKKKQSTEAASTESSTIDPWTELSRAHYNAEKELASLASSSGLKYCVLRPSIVYGPGDRTGLLPRLAVAACYKHTKETMKMPFHENVRLSTVHVADVCSAIYECIINHADLPAGAVYNLADGANISMGELNKLIEQLFGIKTGFLNAIQNMAIKASPDAAAEYVNDKHLPVWKELCRVQGVDDTLLSPFLEPEVFSAESLFVDGKKALEIGDFVYRHDTPTVGLLTTSLDYWRKLGLFPK